MDDPNRYSVSDTGCGDGHLHRIRANDDISETRPRPGQHGSGEIEADNHSPPSPQAKGDYARAHADLEDGILARRQLRIDVGGVLVTSRFASPRLVVVLGQLIKLCHLGTIVAYARSAPPDHDPTRLTTTPVGCAGAVVWSNDTSTATGHNRISLVSVPGRRQRLLTFRAGFIGRTL